MARRQQLLIFSKMICTYLIIIILCTCILGHHGTIEIGFIFLIIIIYLTVLGVLIGLCLLNVSA